MASLADDLRSKETGASVPEHAAPFNDVPSPLSDEALLSISTAAADQPTLQAVLKSLRGVLSNIAGVHSAGLYLLREDCKALKLFAFDNAPDGPSIPLGTELECTGVLAEVLDKHDPVHVPNLVELMLKHPQLEPFASAVGARSAYLFPVATHRKQYGFIAFSSAKGQEFGTADVEVMESLASHVGIAVENAISIDAARVYQKQLSEERDRLSMLLEINNHIVSKLEAHELFHAVSSTMRKHFGNELTSLWLVNKQTGRLERKYLDFPTGKGVAEKTSVLLVGDLEKQVLRLRTPEIYTGDFAGLPDAIRAVCRAEQILAVVLVALVGADGPLGVLAMSSRKETAFSDADLDLLAQIGTQISLVLDNALVYGKLRVSHDEQQEQRLYLESEIREKYNFEEMIGDSPVWRRVLHQITTVAPTDAGVLLLGETGTGKELIARAIHSRSLRCDRTLVKLSCAAVPMGLLESELFGHEKGAFTGALTKQIGRFELANKGTLLLDEVGDIPLELQTKLLRALQEQEFERLGNPHTMKVDVRVIAATNCDLAQMVKDRKFRQDLYYRLNVFPIIVPPLRERSGDLELLVQHFVAKYATRMRKRIETIPIGAMKALRKYHWPGNIRELEHLIERAVILSPANVLQVPIEELLSGTVDVKISTLEEAEREQILQALRACGGLIGGPTGAAARLAINRSTLNSRMRKLGISRADI